MNAPLPDSEAVLAVDDSPSMLQLVVLTLQSVGLKVATAGNGHEALALADHSQYRLVLADVNMPGMDGINLIRCLRQRPAYRHVPILVLTTETRDARRRQGRDAGATGWLVKPFAPEQLIAAVRRAMH